MFIVSRHDLGFVSHKWNGEVMVEYGEGVDAKLQSVMVWQVELFGRLVILTQKTLAFSNGLAIQFSSS